MVAVALNKKELIEIRMAVAGDINFIKSTWLHGLRYGNSWFTFIPKEIYFEAYSKIIEYVLMSPNTIVSVACLKEDKDVILGYAVYTNGYDCLHWSYVKSAWRKIGIAKELVPPTIKTVTHVTNIGKEISTKKGLQFNPFIIK